MTYNLDPEQLKLERDKIQLQLLLQVIFDRERIIPTVASLAATILVVATFNEKILPINGFTKGLIAAMLLIIPISLIDYINKLRQGEKSVADKFPDLKMLTQQKSRWENIYASSAYYYVALISIVIIAVVFVLYSHH